MCSGLQVGKNNAKRECKICLEVIKEVIGSNNNIVKEITYIFFTIKSSADEDFRCKTVCVSISPKPL